MKTFVVFMNICRSILGLCGDFLSEPEGAECGREPEREAMESLHVDGGL